MKTADTVQSGPDDTTALPVSFGQELLWLIDRAVPGSSAYNVPRTVRLRGRLDVEALQRAFDALLARHEILRTTYAFEDDQPVQVIHPPRSVALERVDLAQLPVAEHLAHAQRWVRERTARPFDLANEFPLRGAVLRLADDDHVLHIDTHHIASDGGSREIFFRDLGALYAAQCAGTAANLPVLTIQYADYAAWEREQLAGPRLDDLLAYWRGALAGAAFVLDLPTDFARPAVAADDATSSNVLLPPAFVAELDALARRHDATLNLVVLAAYQILLHRYSGADDVLVGSPVAGRSQPETENLIGYFANMVVQRARFDGDPTVGALLAQLRETWLGAYEHAELPFERLVVELQPGQQLSHSPLFQATFTSVNTAETVTAQLGDCEVLPFGNQLATTKFDLSLFMAKRETGLSLMLRARSTLWTSAGVERFVTHLRRLLEAMVADPAQRVSQLAMLSPAEIDALAGAAAGAVATGEPATVTALFDAVAARVPARVAVVAQDGEITFGELRRRADRLAQRLRACGIERGARVGVLLDRSVETLVAVAGILRAGAAYVPLAIDLPAARRDLLLGQAGADVVVTLAELARALPAGVRAVCLDDDDGANDTGASDAPFAGAATPDDPAYVLFTSGSTGVPKGVVVTHRNIVHYTRAIARVLADAAPDAPGDGFAALDGQQFASVTTLAADLGNTALFPALCAGGTLHLIPAAVSNDATRFATYLADHAIDVLKITPGHLRALLAGLDPAEIAAALPRRRLVTGGEPLGFELAQLVLGAHRCRLLNHYGPTETTVGACTLDVTPDALAAAASNGARSVPIGRSLANTRCYVLDRYAALLPRGVPGELSIGGDGVSRGYLGRDDLTAERFVDHPVFGRLYRTGDRVRLLPDGALEFLGRIDGQVKIRGNRVELGEIEAALLGDPRVAQAAARTFDDATGAYVAAYVVRADAAPDAGDGVESALRTRLADRLPEYMLPRAIVVVDALPRNANGKIDRTALAAPDLPPAAQVHLAPRTTREAELVSIWAEALQRDPATLGVGDDFLALGGHSLLAMRILGKVNRRFGIALPLRALFDAPTVAQLAELVDLEVQLAALDGMSDEEAAQLLAAMRAEGTAG